MVEIEVGWLFPDGTGGARDGRRILRLPGTLPGDVVQAVAPPGRGVIEARVVARLVDAPGRRIPPCPDHATCGGCDLGHATPDARLTHLATAVGRLFDRAPLPVTPSPRRDARARVKLAVEGGRIGTRAPRSHDLVAFDTCGIARPEVQQAIDRLRSHADRLGGVTSVEIRSDGRRAIFAVHGKGVDRAALAPLEDVALDGRRIHGDPTLWIDVGGLHLRASPASFYQVNLEVNRALVTYVTEAVGDAPIVTDLYAGIGNFSLPLAARGASVHAVEIVPDALSDLQAAADRAGLSSRIGTVVQDADRFDPASRYADAVILDPPRRGCPEVLSRLAVVRPPTIVLVSCNPRAAARDVRPLRAAGYVLDDARAFDLFPDTHHLEVVTVWRHPDAG